MAPKSRQTREKISSEVEELRAQLDEAQETLRAIREGEVDALIVSGSKGDQVFSLIGAESIYRVIVETMNEAAFTVTLDGRILYCNTQFSRFVKQSMERIIGHSLQEFVADDNQADVSALLSTARTQSLKQRLVFQAADGTNAPAHISTNLLDSPDGLSICVVAIDLTDLENSAELIQQLQKQEKALRRAEAEARAHVTDMAAIMDAMPTLTIVAHDPQCRSMTGNHATYDLLRLPTSSNVSLSAPAEQRPRTYRLIKDGRELRPEELPIQRAAATGETICDYEVTIAYNDSSQTTIYGNAVPLMDECGKPRGAVGSFVDITDRKRAEEELYILNKTLEDRVAKRTAEAEQRALQLRRLTTELTLAEQRERQRISLVLHDGLQQILVAAKFQIDLLEKTRDVAKMAAHLAELIDDGIETSRSLTAELSPPILKHGGLVPALEWLVNWMRDKHGLTVGLASYGKIELAPEEVLILMFHSTRELLFNVVKHSGVRTARVEIMQTDSRIRVEVEDDGAGFDPIQLKVENTQRRGMGLFSIQERLGYLGGSMEIDSAPGRGSRFTLITPPISPNTAISPIDPKWIVSVSVASQREAAVGSEKRIRVVLVDDHMVMRQGLAGLLRAEPDIEIIGESSDGQSAVDLIREIRPDVVLMDISMPGMDGIEATRIIHEELPEVRIIGLSMFQEEAQQAAMRKAGAVDYLTKSGPSAALIKAIRTCVRVSGKNHAQKPENQADH